MNILFICVTWVCINESAFKTRSHTSLASFLHFSPFSFFLSLESERPGSSNQHTSDKLKWEKVSKSKNKSKPKKSEYFNTPISNRFQLLGEENQQEKLTCENSTVGIFRYRDIKRKLEFEPQKKRKCNSLQKPMKPKTETNYNVSSLKTQDTRDTYHVHHYISDQRTLYCNSENIMEKSSFWVENRKPSKSIISTQRILNCKDDNNITSIRNLFKGQDGHTRQKRKIYYLTI